MINDNNQITSLISTLYGLGGIGKTQTARKYAYDNRNECKVGLWVDADKETIRNSFASLVDTLLLEERKDGSSKDKIRAVKEWLGSNDNWLLILDNLDNEEDYVEYVPKAFVKGNILITTRLANLSINNPSIKSIALEEMEEEEAIEVLMKRTNRKFDEEELNSAKEIVFKLGYLPLAIDLAGAYIRRMKCSLNEFLNVNVIQALETGKKFAGDKQRYPKSVKTTWKLNIEQIKKTEPAAIDILYLISFLHSGNIPIELFKNIEDNLVESLTSYNKEKKKIDILLIELENWSLMKREIVNGI